MIKAIIFDLEGVIIDSEREVWMKSAQEFLGRRGLTYDKEKLKHLTMGTTMQDGMKIWKEYYKLDGKIDDLCKERSEIVRELFNKPVDFIPGFHGFFSSITSKYQTGVATSLESVFLALVDKRLHLLRLFNNQIYSSEGLEFKSKPNPDIFLYAAKQLNNIEPTECVVIEDSPRGVEAAKRAGMQCIAITTSVAQDKLKKADIIVDSYSEININDFF